VLRRWLPAPVIGALTFLAMVVSVTFWGGFVCTPLAIVKLLVPGASARLRVTQLIVAVGAGPWVATNHALFLLLHGRTTARVFEESFDPERSWLLISNHQSWADILILFDAFWRRTPFPRFFLKRQLIWLPLVGFVCWALDMPFMNRNSKEAIARNPALKNRDLETTRAFCEKYKRLPITVINFPEGTRCTEAKRIGRRSPFAHLLRPKSGGLAFAMNAMGDQFAGIIDVTIDYVPTRRKPSWSFLCGEQTAARLIARPLPIPPELKAGDYQEDAEFRMRFQRWVNGIWEEKDRRMSQGSVAPVRTPSQRLLSEPPSSS